VVGEAIEVVVAAHGDRGSRGRSPQCRIRVRGRLSPTLGQALPGFRAVHEDDVTLFEGRLQPGCTLVAAVLRLQSLGIEVVELSQGEVPDT
jgi:hypothetical protein